MLLFAPCPTKLLIYAEGLDSDEVLLMIMWSCLFTFKKISTLNLNHHHHHLATRKPNGEDVCSCPVHVLLEPSHAGFWRPERLRVATVMWSWTKSMVTWSLFTFRWFNVQRLNLNHNHHNPHLETRKPDGEGVCSCAAHVCWNPPAQGFGGQNDWGWHSRLVPLPRRCSKVNWRGCVLLRGTRLLEPSYAGFRRPEWLRVTATCSHHPQHLS